MPRIGKGGIREWSFRRAELRRHSGSPWASTLNLWNTRYPWFKKTRQTTQTQPGVFVSGLVISSTARLMKRKDGTGSFVTVVHEIATQPGLVEYSQFFEVGKDPSIKVNGDEVVAYPRLPEMKSVLLKVNGWKANDKKLVVTRAELIVGSKVECRGWGRVSGPAPALACLDD